MGSTDVTTQSFMFMMTLIVASIVGVAVYMVTDRNETILIFTMITIFGIAAGVGIIPRWWAIISGFVMITGWLLSTRVKGEAT